MFFFLPINGTICTEKERRVSMTLDDFVRAIKMIEPNKGNGGKR